MERSNKNSRRRMAHLYVFCKGGHSCREASSPFQPPSPWNALTTKETGLAQRHDLRAADSPQLVPALQWREDDPQGHLFLTADLELRTAATLNRDRQRPHNCLRKGCIAEARECIC